MTALPGQRSAQSPLRAAMAVQRALGRAARAGGSSSSLVMLVDGQWMRQVIDADGQERLEPYELDSGTQDGER